MLWAMLEEAQFDAVTLPDDESRWQLFKRAFGAKAHRQPFIEYAALPSYGQVYLNHLVGEFHSLKNVCSNEKARDLGETIVARVAAKEVMTWGDAYALDEAIAQMLPAAYLHQRAWCLEARYKDAVGNTEAYDAFMKVEASHLAKEEDDEIHLRARVHNMIRELYRLYTIISCREDMREKLSRKARFILLMILLGIGCFSFLGSAIANGAWHFDSMVRLSPESFINVWGVVFAAGATGGLVSMQRRLQSLPTHGESLGDLVELSSGMTIKLAPVIGGVFAIVLFLIFSSGLASGVLFPAMNLSSSPAGFIDFTNHLQMKGAAEWGKLLVWSFIAGFAERFVPDTLDRLIARGAKDKS